MSRRGELDLERFKRLSERAHGEAPAASAETLREALALWRGAPLGDLGEAPFATTERVHLEELHLTALEARIGADLALGRHAELVHELETLVAHHPYRERLRRELMLALYRSGRQAEALETYQRGRRTLVDDLGIEPGAELQELERAILRQDAALALPTARATSNIPAALTPLVGRRLELAALTSLVRSGEARLLTLTGPGGTGKTRLALEGAWELLSDFRDGVCFVDLSPIDDAELVATQILAALGADEQPGRPIVETLKETLRGQELLLLLDNFEHVTDAGPLGHRAARRSAAGEGARHEPRRPARVGGARVPGPPARPSRPRARPGRKPRRQRSGGALLGPRAGRQASVSS